MIKAEFKVDLVLLFDLRPSCRSALDLMHEHCGHFLKAAFGNAVRTELLEQLRSEPDGWSKDQEIDGLPVEIKPENCRVRACGFAPFRNNSNNWILDNSFVQNPDQLQAQLSKLIEITTWHDEKGSLLEALLSISGDVESPGRRLINPIEGHRHLFFFAGQDQEDFEAVAYRHGINITALLDLLHKRNIKISGIIPGSNAFLETLASVNGSNIEISEFDLLGIMRTANCIASRPSNRVFRMYRQAE